MSFFKYYQEQASFFKKNGQLIKLKKNRYLVNSLQMSQWVYFLESGIVQAEFTLTNGTERLIGYFLPGMTFAQSGSFYDLSVGCLEYKTKTDAVLYQLPKDIFLKSITKNSKLNAEYIDLLLHNQIYLIDRIVYQGAIDLEDKFLNWIIFMVKFYGEQKEQGFEIIVPLNHNDIANMLHTTRVSINKLINKYKKVNIIQNNKWHIIVTNYSMLLKLANKD